MPRWKFWEHAQIPQPTAEPGGTEELRPHIRDAERRRLRRLLQRRADIQYDLAQAEEALLPENRWTQRIEQLNAAIAQAELDLNALTPRRAATPVVQLPPVPIEIAVLDATGLAHVTLQVGNTTLTYQEEAEWAERGHQVTVPTLTAVSGDIEALLPGDVEGPVRVQLVEHLRHSFSVLAHDALERTLNEEPLPRVKLADLVRPCPTCGRWLDPKGRCPYCTELEWQRQHIRSDQQRLLKERQDTEAEMHRLRERRPVIQRQIAEVEADIEDLEKKGVEPM